MPSILTLIPFKSAYIIIACPSTTVNLSFRCLTLTICPLDKFWLISRPINRFLSIKYPETHYDWENIDCQDYQFPDNFTWGVATASHQIEGNNNNNWTDFEKRTGIEQSEGACEHWTNWKQDFQLIQNLGVKSYRFSIEWSRIQPEKDVSISKWNY